MKEQTQLADFVLERKRSTRVQYTRDKGRSVSLEGEKMRDTGY